MDNNTTLKLQEFLKLLLKNKVLFIILFIVTAILSFAYVLNTPKTYKSTLIIDMPLNKGIETEYTINNVIRLNNSQINKLLVLDDDIQVLGISLGRIKHERNSTFGVVEFTSNVPDTQNKIKNAFINYFENVEYLKTLKNSEHEKYNDIIKTANLEYNSLIHKEDFSTQTSKINTLNKAYNFISAVDIKEKMYEAKLNLTNSKPIVEISYSVSNLKSNPSYSMLLVLATIFSIFLSLTIIVFKVLFIDLLKD